MIAFPWQDPAAVFAGLAHLPYALFLHSQDGGKWSFIALNPAKIWEGNGRPPIVEIQDYLRQQKDAQKKIQKNSKKNGLPPFPFGVAGYVSFEAGLCVDLIPLPQTTGQPTSPYCFCDYTTVIAFDAENKKAWLCSTLGTDVSGLTDYLSKQHSLLTDSYPPVFLEPVAPRDIFHQNVAAARALIAAGDIYQVNISQRFVGELPDTILPYALFCRLARDNPAPYAAYFHTSAGILISASPERFIHSDGSTISTRPIKGTALRLEDPEADHTVQQQLLYSSKELAENRMIVDLLRHDLAQSCVAGSVRVPAFAALESYEGLHHLVSTIEGTLRPEISPFTAWWNALPGGSVSGAPKRRALEIIADLEAVPRGHYCGSLGYFSPFGQMDSSILIRTLVIEKQQIRLDTGCGITWQSDAAAEYAESLTKANPILRALSRGMHCI